MSDDDAVLDNSTAITVDGEKFEAKRDPETNSYHVTWVSGINNNYGFSTRLNGNEPMTRGLLHAAASNFLAQIDPKTGLFREDDE